MMNYSKYEPIKVEGLPAPYLGMFRRLELTFTPPNDTTVVLTLLGKPLELCTITKGRHKEPIVPIGYQKAIWELREGHLRWCPSEQRLYRRDADTADHPGERYELNSWHPVKTIEAEYGIESKAQQLPAYSATIIRESQRVEWFAQVERGVRIDPLVWVRRDGHVTCLSDEPDLAVTQTFDTTGMSREAVKQAERICEWLTVDDKSARNLLRMFATPWLEPFKQLTYVLSGHGGDGKTLIMSQAVIAGVGIGKVFPAFKTQQFCRDSAYTTGQESMMDAMDGMSFAYDDEAGEVTERMLPALRALSTGASMQARVIGGRYRTVKPSATMVILTNQGFADSTESSDRRRFVKVEFHSNKGRSYDEYHAIELFVHAHPAAMFAASCQLWEQSDEPDVVNLSPARQISDEMYWVISEICSNEQSCGQPIASKKAFRAEFKHAIDDNMLQLLGLKNSNSVALGGKQRVVRVADWDRFDRYRQAVMETEQDDTVVAPPPAPLDANPLPLPSELGFACDYVRADRHKVARDWKQLAASPNVDTSTRPDSTAYAVVPSQGYVVVDMDVPEEGDTGWQVMGTQVGTYGSDAFPTTYLVGTPSGGVHAYYRIPPALQGQLKNAAHPHGMPIDLRVDGKGYVIGAGSHVESGDYRLLDLPDGDTIPELSDRMCRWLANTPGYMLADHNQPMRPVFDRSEVDGFGTPARATGSDGRPPIDMTPIPEGQRNVELHKWAFGRALNHPGELKDIEFDTYQRGRASGLADGEITTIWESIMRELRRRGV